MCNPPRPSPTQRAWDIVTGGSRPSRRSSPYHAFFPKRDAFNAAEFSWNGPGSRASTSTEPMPKKNEASGCDKKPNNVVTSTCPGGNPTARMTGPSSPLSSKRQTTTTTESSRRRPNPVSRKNGYAGDGFIVDVDDDDDEFPAMKRSLRPANGRLRYRHSPAVAAGPGIPVSRPSTPTSALLNPAARQQRP